MNVQQMLVFALHYVGLDEVDTPATSGTLYIDGWS